MNYLQEKEGLGEYASDISDTLLEEDFQGLVIEEDMEQEEEKEAETQKGAEKDAEKEKDAEIENGNAAEMENRKDDSSVEIVRKGEELIC